MPASKNRRAACVMLAGTLRFVASYCLADVPED